MHDKQIECDKARKRHNAVSKTLISLREEVQLAKSELSNVIAQLKNVKDDLQRTDDLLLKEHAQQHAVYTKRESIETQTASFLTKCAKLEEIKAQHSEAIMKLDHEIDEEDAKLAKIRTLTRNIISKKDMISAHMMAAEVEHQKQSEVMETKAVEAQNAIARYHKLQAEFETAKSLTFHLLDKKKAMQELSMRQSEQKLLLVALERDLSRQTCCLRVYTIYKERQSPSLTG